MKSKLCLVLFVFMCAFAGLIGRIAYIKVVHGQEYENLAKNQQVNKYDMTITPVRGDIVDSNNQPFAVSITVYNIVLDSIVLADSSVSDEEREKTLTALSETLDLDYNELKGYITIDPKTNKPNLNTHWKYLKKQIDRETGEALKAMDLKGVVYENDIKREYPFKTLACHVLGFIRNLKWGIESSYDNEMKGSAGRSYITFDGASSVTMQEIPAQNGNTIVTTLDYNLQQYAEETVATLMEDYNPQNSGVIMMNPNTGAIFAMASSGKFDNNDPATPIKLSDSTFAEEWEKKTEDEKYEYLYETWKNFNISSTFEPGSVFKPFVLAAALEENVVSEDSTFYCSGSKVVADTTIKCNKVTGHGQQTLEEAFANSCNVAFMDIGEKLGAHLLRKYQADFGFGKLTGIDLPGEVSAETLMYDESRIGPVELATMSFGQSFNATPLQILNAYCAIVNGGNLMKPYIVSKVIDENGIVVKENEPVVVRKPISKETSDIIKKYSESVVNYGTGKKAKIEGYSIGGKTGTGQQGDRTKNLHTLSYEAFLPADNPQIAIFVVMHIPETYVDNVTSVGPATKTLFEKVIKYLAIEPSYESGEDSSSHEDDTKKVVLKEYTGQNLADAAKLILEDGLDYEIAGLGNKITKQVPKAGTEIEEGSKIILYVEKAEGDKGSIAVPDVVSLSLNDALKEIYAAGLIGEFGDAEEGTVVSQSPPKGVFVEENSAVNLVVDSGVNEGNAEE
ncbi:MAG: penicillin-binding transpeptidase domain-containing protein [Lachnospiraceae bacterium]|nr:penicillin-binding transpeptidase domain-containing protein [Lachnospiraceae bacterium]